jgi:hypothetical protein
MLRKASLAFVLGTLAGLPASAAALNSVKGHVFVNHGTGFESVHGRAQTMANVGDLVMAKPDGHAKLAYPDGCVVDINPGAVVTVQEHSPCEAGSKPNYAVYALGAAAIVGGAVAISELANGGHNNKPASP